MAGRKLWGLAAAGTAGRSFLGRIPALRSHLGPVFSTSFRLANRIANTLHAGTPVRTAAELQPADVVLICLPDVPLEPLIDKTFLDALIWKRKSVLLIATFHGNLSAEALRSRGASVANFSLIPGLPDHFLITGDPPAARIAKSLAHELNGSVIEFNAASLTLFESALTLSSSLFTPLLELAAESLRQAGLDPSAASKTSNLLFAESLRSFRRAGRKSWAGPVALADRAATDAQQEALATINPATAAYFRDAVRHSFELYQTFPELTRYDKARWEVFRKRQLS